MVMVGYFHVSPFSLYVYISEFASETTAALIRNLTTFAELSSTCISGTSENEVSGVLALMAHTVLVVV